MMRQYFELKRKYPGMLLFFRLGDFYELFDDDAREVSTLLGLTLTHRVNMPMCGVPYHAAESYINIQLQSQLDLGSEIMSSGPTLAFLISQFCLFPISSILKHVLHWVARSLLVAPGLHLMVSAILIERFPFPKNFPKLSELTFY